MAATKEAEYCVRWEKFEEKLGGKTVEKHYWTIRNERSGKLVLKTQDKQKLEDWLDAHWTS